MNTVALTSPVSGIGAFSGLAFVVKAVGGTLGVQLGKHPHYRDQYGCTELNFLHDRVRDGTSERYPVKPTRTGADFTGVEIDTREYQKLRRNRHSRQPIQAECKSRGEAARFIQFAQAWIPYGGATNEDIFISFGMTRTRFIQKLRHFIAEVDLDAEAVRELTDTYA